jgi:hypothetical protein
MTSSARFPKGYIRSQLRPLSPMFAGPKFSNETCGWLTPPPMPVAPGVLQGSRCQSQFALQCKAGHFAGTTQTGYRTLST